MRKILLSTLIATVFCAASFAQTGGRRCGTTLVEHRLAQKDPAAYQARLAEMAQRRADAQTGITAAKGTAQYPIPVVFHIVVTQTMLNRMGGTAGIAQRVDSQMRVLNRDFNGKNADSTLIPSVFKPLYANVGARFGLAKLNPSNQSTPGYEIRVLGAGVDSTFDADAGGMQGSTYSCSDVKYATRGLTAWDASTYLNVWITNITYNGQDGILGITCPPSFVPQFGFPQGELGIVLTYGAFGKRTLSSDYYISGIDRGRTLTHEMGHFFELSHIWGDDNGACPGGAGYQDDGISDTPIQGAENYSCPTFPHVSCSVSSPNGDMFMNYMDYTDDRCMQMFSNGQKAVMAIEFGNPAGGSYGLTQHPNLTYNAAAVANVTNDVAFSVSPNPGNGYITILSNMPASIKTITVTNSMGQIVYQAAAENNAIQSIDLSAVAKGIYFVKCTGATGSNTQKVVFQ